MGARKRVIRALRNADKVQIATRLVARHFKKVG
jgi:hypothetical protein